MQKPNDKYYWALNSENRLLGGPHKKSPKAKKIKTVHKTKHCCLTNVNTQIKLDQNGQSNRHNYTQAPGGTLFLSPRLLLTLHY